MTRRRIGADARSPRSRPGSTPAGSRVPRRRPPRPAGALPPAARLGRGRATTAGWPSAGARPADLAAEFGTPLFVYDEDHLRARCREAVATFGDGRQLRQQGVPVPGHGPPRARGGHAPRRRHRRRDARGAGRRRPGRAAGAARQQQERRRAGPGPRGRRRPHRGRQLRRARPARPPARGRRAGPEGAAAGHARRRGPHPRVRADRPDRLEVRLRRGRRATWPRRSSGRGASPAVDLVGVHLHIGSQVFVADFFRQAVDVVAPWVRDLDLPELSIGGGLGVPYVEGEEAPDPGAVGPGGHRRLPGGRASGAASPPSRAGRSPPRRRSRSTRWAPSRTSPACAPTWRSTAA